MVFLPPFNALNAFASTQCWPPIAFFVPRYRSNISTGILTCFPSTTPFGLILGPDSPSLDEPTEGTLRLSGHWILTNVCVTQADILTSALSTPTDVDASPRAERSPTDIESMSHSFGRPLSPVHCRRNNALPVSYYALFKGWLLLSKPPGCFSIVTSFSTWRSFWGLSR